MTSLLKYDTGLDPDLQMTLNMT